MPDPATPGRTAWVDQLAAFERRIAALEQQLRLANRIGQVVQAVASVNQGPSALATPLVYTGLTVTVDPGTWLVYAQATVSSQSAADSKCIGIYNVNASAFITNTNGPAIDSPGGVGTNFSAYTFAELTFTVQTQLRIIGFQNGTSQITIGFPGGLQPTQRITAVRIA